MDNHLESMQTELDNLRDILRGEGYSIDANTLLGVNTLFGVNIFLGINIFLGVNTLIGVNTLLKITEKTCHSMLIESIVNL